MDEQAYIKLMMNVVGDGDPAVDQQFSDEPLDPPTSPGQMRCTETDVKVQTVKMGAVLLQWGACSGVKVDLSDLGPRVQSWFVSETERELPTPGLSRASEDIE